MPLSVAADGAQLGMGVAGKTLALVDTSKDFRVSVPAESRATWLGRIARLHGSLAWLLVGLAALATALAARPVSRSLRRLRKRLALYTVSDLGVKANNVASLATRGWVAFS